MTIDWNVVRISSMILPPWAENNHHFVFYNAASLERKAVKEDISNWINLVFGANQHSKEAYNLFKPLTDEVAVSEKW